MKKVLIVIMLSILSGCGQVISDKKIVDETILNYSEADSLYRKHGYYKEVFRIFNYEYKDSVVRSCMLDSVHGVHNIINEFGDTIHQIYIDYSNYPKREE